MILKEVYQRIKVKYKIELLAGEEGMERSIEWLHNIEDKDVGSFLHGDELILTTGIANQGEAWLLEFVTELYKKNVCGVLINIGPYIKEVPETVIEFCRQQQLSLFTTPWEVRLVDMTKEISAMIFQQEKEQITIVNGMKDAIFYPEEVSLYCNPLKRKGYLIQRKFCPIVMEIKGRRIDDDYDNRCLELLRYRINFQFPKAVLFSLSKYYVVVLYRCEKEEIQRCVDIIDSFRKTYDEFKISNIIVGPNRENIQTLHHSYQIACRMTNLSKKKKKEIMNFEKLGSYQILLNVENINFLKEYVERVLGPIQREDNVKGSELLPLFRSYLETDCSVQETAKIHFCHRNTINQRIKHIREILGVKEIDILKKTEYMIAYEIYDMID